MKNIGAHLPSTLNNARKSLEVGHKRAHNAQKEFLSAYLCVPPVSLRTSAISALKSYFNAESAEVRRGTQRYRRAAEVRREDLFDQFTEFAPGDELDVVFL